MTREEFRTQKALGLLTIYLVDIRFIKPSNLNVGRRKLQDIFERHCYSVHLREASENGVGAYSINHLYQHHEVRVTFLIETTFESLEDAFAEVHNLEHIQHLSYLLHRPIVGQKG